MAKEDYLGVFYTFDVQQQLNGQIGEFQTRFSDIGDPVMFARVVKVLTGFVVLRL